MAWKIIAVSGLRRFRSNLSRPVADRTSQSRRCRNIESGVRRKRYVLFIQFQTSEIAMATAEKCQERSRAAIWSARPILHGTARVGLFFAVVFESRRQSGLNQRGPVVLAVAFMLVVLRRNKALDREVRRPLQ